MDDKQKGGALVEASYPDPRTPQPLSFTDIRRNTKLVKQALQEIMVKDVDYGTTPGCGDKPGLKKPGSEKLSLLFKLALFPQVEDKSENGEFTYIVRTKVIHQPTGIELGEGVGAASTLEDKYAWRAAVCDEEFESTPEERRRIKWEKGYNGGKPTSKKQVRDNPAGKQNTVLKMASKRSKVDAVIQVTGASDIFNQGEDDIIIDENQSRNPSKPKEKAPTPAAGQTRQEAQPSEAEASQEKKPVVADGVKMTSKRDGICKGCSKEIKIGSEIVWSKAAGAFHAGCVA